MPALSLDIVIEDKRWRKIPRLEASINRAARMALRYLPKNLRGSWSINLLLTNDAALRRLNRQFRGKNKPTNVLSFPEWHPQDLPRLARQKGFKPLGDIALGYQYMVAEAKKDHKILINHVSHLVLHGLLHLLGYDHTNSKDAVRMEKLEQKIMAALGLPDPYSPAVKSRYPRQRKR